jgi:hypothetical protein
VAVACVLLLQLAALYFPWLRDLLGTDPPTLQDLVPVAFAPVVVYVAIRAIRRSKPQQASAA